jgi:adenylate cyclase class 1
MPHTEQNSSSIDQGVDRKTLKTIKQRFLQVNSARLARTKSALAPRQQIFLELLPMLFHVNHPMLPGYVSHKTPKGLADFTPSKRDIQKCQRLARSFTYHRQPTLKRRIYGIFLMGSCGTIAQSESSDLDIWICHPDDLEHEEQLLLRAKTHSISRWARTIGLEAHFFLMDAEKFRLGERESLSTEDCGSSQHYLLLDEFYRTGLLIGGRIPIWWLIPPDEDQHYDYYAETLRKKRFVKPRDTVDFGGVGHIPAGEFIGAGVWQLYKAIDSPYKSALKILLTEVYASEYPNVEPLSTTFKRAIYNDQLDIDELDPYVMVYRKLENYLIERGEPKRLELIRRCFYFKVGKSVTRPSRYSNKSWQRQLIEKLVNEWQWSSSFLHSLDIRNKWKISRVIAEQKELVRELTNSYRFLLDFARRTRSSALINSQEMTVLGRKLYAAFERKAGKIEWVNPGIAPNLNEEYLTFYPIENQSAETDGWAVTTEYLPPNGVPTEQPLKRTDDLIALLCWCHYNGLLDNNTRASISEGNHGVTDYELQNIIRCLQQKLPVARLDNGDEDEAHDRFARAMRPTQIQLFINVGTDPMAEMRSQGVELISDKTDSFGYSELEDNLAINVEQVLVNSWGEVSTHRYNGDYSLIRCLRDYMQLLPPSNNAALPQLDIRCFCPTRPAAITLRVEELFRDIAACFYSGTRPESTRYILKMQREYYVLQFQDGRLNIERAHDQKSLFDQLAKTQRKYSPIVLDRYCLQDSPLMAITHCAQADCIQVFYHRLLDTADVYVLDEMGSLYKFNTPFVDERTLLAPLDQFIQSTLYRQRSESQDFISDAPQVIEPITRDIEYFEIVDRRGALVAERRDVTLDSQAGYFFNLQAIGDRDIDNNILFNIFCEDREFTELELGKELYDKVAEFILNRRGSKQRYPCYITDLDLSRCISHQRSGSIQTVYYLRYKQKLEKALNHALQML